MMAYCRCVDRACGVQQCLLPVVVLILGSLISTVVTQTNPWPSVTLGQVLNHLTVDHDRGSLYVGAVNRLYVLSTADLRTLQEVSTGPRMDSPGCIYASIADGDCSDLQETPNYNKILVLDNMNNQLITCGTVFQGACETRRLQNISIATEHWNRMTAANEADKSTVAFLGPSPITDNALYVGATFSGDIDLRYDVVPALASRRTTGTTAMEFVFFDPLERSGSYIELHNKEMISSYIISYKAGFSSGGYSYFVTTQREQANLVTENHISKIVQVCQNSVQCSYIEMPLKCTNGIVDYNVIQSAILVQPGSQLASQLKINTAEDIVIGVFSKSMTNSDDIPGDDIAVCIYQLQTVRENFTENLRLCFANGPSQPTGQQFGDTGCIPSMNLDVPLNYCGDRPDCPNSPLSGTESVTSAPILVLHNQSAPTSIAIDIVNDQHTVAFVGMKNGHFKKLLLESPQSREITDILVDDNSPIGSDLMMSQDKQHLYVMTQNKITKVPVSECGSQTTCAGCRALNDPYCGWCSLENKCTPMSECSAATDARRWLTAAEPCIAIVSVQPELANIHIPIDVTIRVQQLPPSQDYQCAYMTESAVVTQPAAVNAASDIITCSTISNNDGLRIDQQDYINVTLAVRSVTTTVDFLSRHFQLYSCSEHTSCGQCTRSQFPCHWCVHDNRCEDLSESCMESGPILYNSSDKCPQVDSSKTGDLLLPTGVPQDFRIAANKLLNDNSYKCRLFENAEASSALAEFQGTYQSESQVLCQDVEFDIAGIAEKTNLVLRVFWKSGINAVDQHINLHVYSCRDIANDCSSCLADPDPAYRCEWCARGGCVYRSECTDVIDSCPMANIDTVEPTTYPIDGGTRVTIIGTNLGQKSSDIYSVKIADQPCAIMEYETSQKIVCETVAVNSPKNGSLDIEYNYMGDRANIPYHPVQYKNPRLLKISPKMGPQSGGTDVTIEGQELNTGKDITVTIGNMPCPVFSKSDQQLVCRTTMASVALDQDISLQFDSATRTLPLLSNGMPQLFDLRPDPVIEKIYPSAVFESGGRIITVEGTDLDVVQRPRLKLLQPNYASEGKLCKAVDATVLQCPSPPVFLNRTAGSRRRRQADDNVYTMVLLMDGVECTQNISACYQVDDQITLQQDPIYDEFNVKQLRGDTLTLTGRHLALACTKEEVEVFVGEARCSVDSLQNDKLLCTPPKEQPEGKSSGSLPEVRVRFGNINKTLGKLEYATQLAKEVWIIIVAVGGGVLITIIIIVIVVYKRRSADVERQNKKLQIQLDTLESNVRNECKQAFAELQTEVSDFTSDLNVIGIPFWDYKMYTFRVLFPGLKDHPVLHQNDSVNKFGGIDQGLHQFSQLLNSKQFLLIFIRTLEQQKNFSIRDKSVVASLLMIVLQDKMEYATDILKSLLNELIDKSVEKKHPKLMLRRTESVVEKLLSNWLSLSMYTYLKKHAGKMLFMLFKAIKHQTEKGPIDVFTSEAKYSLSEDRLLREKVEPKTLTLHVFMNDMKEPATFKALDNDTVTQAKEKALDAIYMNSPFSPRPSVYDVELEWRSGRSGHLPLQDEDVTTQVVQGWKRVNTLLHYHVPDGASLVLVPSKSKNDLVKKKHGMIEIANFQSSLPPIVTVEEGTKVWHLVKHDDNQNVQRTQKVISEIFLTRLLATKGTLQQYIDDLFTTILRADNGLPPAVKYLFDFLDTAARRHNIVDVDVVHTWKSNSLPLRFWVNIIKNPEFIFDIHKSNIVDSCLSVIAQTFMDSCSTAEHRLGKDSPSNKLLFAKDIPRFRSWVSKFYKGVQDMAPITDQDMTRVMMEMSMTNFTDFNVSVALQDLYKYAMQYNFELLEALDDDPSAKRLHLANRFEQVQAVIEGTPLY